MELTHKEICSIAVRWLKRAHSAGGHGCHVAVSEVVSGWDGEIPDAIGFRSTGDHTDGSVVVEVKLTRSDFFADKNKPHRNGQVVGMGNWRYYMCPENLISPNELPEKWGLLYVNSRGHVKSIVSPYISTNYAHRKSMLDEMYFESNQEREKFLLVRLLYRVGDPEALNNQLKKIRSDVSRYKKKFSDTSDENARLKSRIFKMRSLLEQLDPDIDFSSF